MTKPEEEGVIAARGDLTSQARLMSTREVATHLGVGYRTVRRAVLSGELRYLPLGKGWKFRLEDVSDYLERISRTGVDPQPPPERRRRRRRTP
ncbi:MAG: Helix-turn-helix domain [Frankiaceae bacterium]|jgi:excisionase family DNA binding protein|nr:Helix-turn-helix domain [Frankiaceae bacterium]